MEEYLVFARNHPMLIAGLVALIGLILWTEFNRLTRKYKQIGPAQAVQVMNSEGALVLDVREEAEMRTGKLSGARHIALGQLKNRMVELEAFKSSPVLVYCRSGSRSAHACHVMAKAGFQNVHNLAGGILAWESANLPISKR